MCGGASQVCSPQIFQASWMSLGMMVTRLAWMAQRLVSSNNLTRYTSAASLSTSSAEGWNRISCATSKLFDEKSHELLVVSDFL